ncbi:LcrG family type III secretion system chaperone [Vibrio campbellii]|uniref:LcrG family type III secretion system chaperone n=1 Tax=Vibrio campbellii TaxID=680 RepID=UPI001F07D3DA|nr:LcrG family type III secretion system chaperone [Vibrio campbellii]UMM02046.1 LcrG family type III secretion system chaperone [Vibrio campbellii]
MKQPFTETIENSELAIRNAEDRTDVFNELLEGLGVGPVAGNILLDGLNASPQLMKQAEHELLEEVQRRRQQQHQPQAASTKGTRRKRPSMMRGMVI